ncbi:MAG: nucleotide sugar dehydrogenase [Actinophytocola sp.]|nr:nucleotide sugar dehydrogenase [Actinophytocola sp.]
MHPTIAVIGTGYLGTTHAAGMAELGFDVIGVDVDPDRVARLQRGDAPFFEPRLEALLRQHTAAGRLRFTTELADAADVASVFFLCVGTPQQEDGLAADMRQVLGAVRDLAPLLRRPALLVGKSTVPVGTAHALAQLAQQHAPDGVPVDVAWNPEFLREGHGVQDTLRPDRLVLGVSSAEAEQTLREIYARPLQRGVPLVVTDTTTAELVKCAANAFLATKISFINMVAELSEAASADVLAVSEALGHDARIGRAFLHPGLGFGGGCLPKDVRALIAQADDLGVDQPMALLRAVDQINLRCRSRMAKAAVDECGGSVAGRRIAVLGAAFKPLTDDVRDSPALDVARELRRAGADVQVYDPMANSNAKEVAPELQFVETAEDAVRAAHLVLHLTEWAEFRLLDPARLLELVDQPCLLDGRNSLDAAEWRAAG